MKPTTRIPRPIAALALLLSTSGCSGIAVDQAGGEDEIGEAEGHGGSESSGSDPTDTGEDTGSETDTGSGEDTGTDDGDTEEGLADPQLVAGICDPQQDQVIDYDLAEAHAEIAAELVRESVLNNQIVPAIPLSPRPFFNHFRFEHPFATEPTLAIDGELWKPQAAIDAAAPRYQLQFAVSGPMMTDDQRPPLDLAIVVDAGASMVGLPLELANLALTEISSAIRPGDRVTVIVAGDEAQLLETGLVETSVEVSPAGGAAIHQALELAYAELAELEPMPGAQPRVMLISAGHFEVDYELLEMVGNEAEFGTTLTSVGVGASDQFDDSSLRALAGVGKGASVYAPSGEQLAAFEAEFTAKMVVSANDVEVELILPPGLAVSERDPSWGENLSVDNELAVLGPNDALVFHHELVNCGELAPDAVIAVHVYWTEPSLAEPQELVWEQPVAELGYGAMATRKGAAVLAYTDALIAYRDGTDARYGALLDALGHISDALESMPTDPDLIEMSEVLAALENL